MRVGVNARSLTHPQIRGWARYTLQLLRYLPEFGAELVLFCDRPVHEEHLALLQPGSFRVIQSPALRYLAWEQAWLAQACYRERVQLLHAPANYGLPLLSHCPRVLTLHDAIDVAFERSAGWKLKGALVNASFWAARLAASEIITVSNHAKSDLTKHYKLSAERVSVIYEASDLDERAGTAVDEQAAIDCLGLPPGPFVLYAGGFERRKNVGFLIDAFRLASLDGVSLVLVGSDPPGDLSYRVSARKIQSPEVFTGFVSDAALAGLYRRALAFVYPSLYEGFGLQLCEAMSFGCPVLAADATSLPEVLGDGGEIFSLQAPESLAALLRRLALDSSYRDALACRARKRSSNFSWRKTAQLTYDVYRRCT
jgi:glycosyltransferase involved in cell wall biosynthesis